MIDRETREALEQYIRTIQRERGFRRKALSAIDRIDQVNAQYLRGLLTYDEWHARISVTLL